MTRVCEIPWTFRRDPDATLRSLLEASGYERFRDKLTSEALQDCLRSRPELAEAWVRYSEDKKIASGWYLEGLMVGYYQPGQGMVKKERYPDPLQACAAFIRKELDGMLGP